MAGLNLTNIKKVYDKGAVSVKDFNLEIRDKEFRVLAGPCACGKSTTPPSFLDLPITCTAACFIHMWTSLLKKFPSLSTPKFIKSE